MRCLHHVEATDESVNEMIIPMKILVPHYEVNFFNRRIFQIVFDNKKYMELSGLELSTLAREGQVSKQLLRIPESIRATSFG